MSFWQEGRRADLFVLRLICEEAIPRGKEGRGRLGIDISAIFRAVLIKQKYAEDAHA